MEEVVSSQDTSFIRVFKLRGSYHSDSRKRFVWKYFRSSNFHFFVFIQDRNSIFLLNVFVKFSNCPVLVDMHSCINSLLDFFFRLNSLKFTNIKCLYLKIKINSSIKFHCQFRLILKQKIRMLNIYFSKCETESIQNFSLSALEPS